MRDWNALIKIFAYTLLFSLYVVAVCEFLVFFGFLVVQVLLGEMLAGCSLLLFFSYTPYRWKWFVFWVRFSNWLANWVFPAA